MTKQDFLNGKAFCYNGHFRRIAHAKFHYNEELKKDVEVLKAWRYDAVNDRIVNVDNRADHWHLVGEPADDKVCVNQRNFGNIQILFKECYLEVATA